jgi:formylglycine-generating enzyme required for sulfatase activity
MPRQIRAALVTVVVGWASTAAAAEEELSLDLGGPSLEIRRIPKGTFVEGSPVTEAGRELDETPRNVTITRAFWLGKVPVTRAQFARFVSETRHVTDAEKGQSGGFGWDAKTNALVQKKEFSWRNPGFTQKDDDPVVLVTFGDANAFVAWASRKTGRRVRLPTEAEWEYGARAGTTTAWFGAAKEEDALAIGWFKVNAGGATHSVALKKPNAFGLFDMSGNVFEWCRDVYAPYPAGDAVDPENSTNTSTEPERRVLRGGSWLKDPRRGRSAARYRNTPGSRNADNGFRVAVDDEAGITPLPNAVPSADFATTAPAASAAPVATTSRGSEGTPWALFAAPAAAAGAAVAWVLARRKRQPPSASGIGTREQDDGFWVRAQGLTQGARVRYECVVGGVEVSDVVPLDGGEETFVYTGTRPSAIRITEVVTTPAQPYRAQQPSSVTGPAAPRISVNRISVTDTGLGGVVRPITPMPPSSRPSGPPPPPSSPASSRGSEDESEPFAGYPRAY